MPRPSSCAAAALLLIAIAVASLDVTSALKSAPALGVPCSTVDARSPGAAGCNASYVPINYYALMQAGTLSLADLLAETSGNCAHMEDAFEETFTSKTVRARTHLWMLRCMRCVGVRC
jgi:ABC-type sugar transport system substrate-binding protein